jgi:hypothetical protein
MASEEKPIPDTTENNQGLSAGTDKKPARGKVCRPKASAKSSSPKAKKKSASRVVKNTRKKKQTKEERKRVHRAACDRWQ